LAVLGTAAVVATALVATAGRDAPRADGGAPSSGPPAARLAPVPGTATSAPEALAADPDIRADGTAVVLPRASAGHCDQAVADAEPVAVEALEHAGSRVGEVRLYRSPGGGQVCAKLVKPEGSPLRDRETHVALTLCGTGGSCDRDWHSYLIDAGPVAVATRDGCVTWRASMLDAAGREWWVRDSTGQWGCGGG
ncbi:hypothetical protein GTR02_15865, partial [Kineococcus sp. R8]